MGKWGSIFSAAALALGTGALSYVLLSPAVWTRTELDFLPLAVGMLGVSALRPEFQGAHASGPAPRILRISCLTTWAVAAGLLVTVLLGVLEDRSVLGSPAQVTITGFFGLVAVGGIAWLAGSTKASLRELRKAGDLEREERLAAVRAQATRDIDEFAARLRPPDGPKSAC